MLPIRIISTGKALPAEKISSSELDLRLNKTSGFVKKKSGVDYRYFSSVNDFQSDLAAAALRDAINAAQIQPSSIDLLLSTSAVPDQALPSMACRIMQAAGLPAGISAFDINASCLGFMAGLQLAATLLNSGTYRRIAIVSAEIPSRGLDWSDPESSLIFGDGAAAAIVEIGSETVGCQAYRMETYPEGKTYCEILAGGTRCNPTSGMKDSDFLFHMDGKKVFKLASKLMEGFLDRLFEPLGYNYHEVDLVVPHQASYLSMQHMSRRLGLPQSAIIDIYHSHGNQVSASIPTALHEAMVTGRLTEGAKVLLVGTAAGLTLGGMVLTV
ncbi:3-oxoacyl-[acyl-carrier-protein] synthase III C-terminal domain-containing protein [Pragia fontium]|uniref:3-oxoacyl-[acyl-carrier-protein] synthase III C-terminal domain-containing protein n=1 Tax=Pragia fontium TaxID=82985 RepID=UPI00064A95E3|nr:3-oxoacyl-[acyl-carrier-protein] synthase III C-terminal domain-containing protein [Pragia fontium]AKJ42661.1 3-oxoacyl-ACP synthase [Pragia fontium]